MTWTDIYELAEALDQAHPDMPLLELEPETLRQLVIGLEGFTGPDHPEDPGQLTLIRAAWIARGGEADDDRRWDFAI